MALSNWDGLAKRLTSTEKSGFVFGAISVFLIGFAFLFVLFVNIGEGQETTRSFVDMLTVGFFGAFAFSMVLAAQRRKKRGDEQALVFEAISSVTMQNQLSTVLPVGLMAGIIVVMVNLSVSVGGNILLGSAFGSIEPTNFLLGFLAGVAEELFFRGFLQTMIEFFLGGTAFGRFFAPIPTAMIFAWFHYFAYGDNPIAWLVMFAIGLVFGYLHAISRDIGVPMLAHVINNTFAMMPFVVAFLTGNMFVIVIIGAVLVVVFMYSASMKSGRR